MSFAGEGVARSLALMPPPKSYGEIRVHHVVILYAAWNLVLSTGLVHKLKSRILSLLSSISERCVPLIHAGVVPDFVIRYGIRVQCRNHLQQLRTVSAEQELLNKRAIVEELHSMPIAIETAAANEQHYEVPARFYDLCLGPNKKYSGGYWPSPHSTFEESELAMLDLYCQRAGVQDGMRIVDLGCGWGSLTLHLARKYPTAKITGISNSHSQREYILRTAKDRGLNVDNINIITVRMVLVCLYSVTYIQKSCL